MRGAYTCFYQQTSGEGGGGGRRKDVQMDVCDLHSRSFTLHLQCSMKSHECMSMSFSVTDLLPAHTHTHSHTHTHTHLWTRVYACIFGNRKHISMSQAPTEVTMVRVFFSGLCPGCHANVELPNMPCVQHIQQSEILHVHIPSIACVQAPQSGM
jgi:hypothetical protein